MTTKSKSKFCTEILGVKPQFMAKIENRLNLVKVKGKKKLQIDLYGTKTLAYLAERDIKIKEQTPDPPPTKPKKKVLGNNPTGKATPEPPTDPENPDDETKIELDKKGKKIDNALKAVKLGQIRGNLIEKQLTDIFFGKIYQIDSDQLKQLGNKLSPKIFSIINERNKIKTNSLCKLLKIEDKEEKESIESIFNSGEKEIKTKIVGEFESAIHLILKNIKDDIDNFLDILEADAI